ncbi:putative polyketide synthase [Usnea florida]
MLINARTGHKKVPPDRFNADSWYHPEHDRRGAICIQIHTKHGFFLEEDASVFDAPFFSIAATEAAGMDPMQRKLLEVSYEAFENAGLPIRQLGGSRTSCYTGVMTNDYEMLSTNDPCNLSENPASGTSRAMLSNRVSWFFDLQGASLTLDTACSSSLYALHLAYQSIRIGESDQALVTGANMILHPNFISQLPSMHMLSPYGISYSFDSRANGYARGEAIAGLIVKPLSKAIADGNTIRAIVRGSGANQDDKTPGITMPSGKAQAALIRSTYAAAGLSLNDTAYFESHGTGTSLGDPIELGAIGESFGAERSPKAIPLYVGSVKTNVGHTEGTAGLAGVMKAVLRLALPLETMTWPTSGLRRASVNSFGFGGSNARLILDDAHHYLQSRRLSGNHLTLHDHDIDHDSGISTGSASFTSDSNASSGHRSKLFVFSTQDQNGIQRISTSYSKHLNNSSEELSSPTYFEDLAHTLATRRSLSDFRSFAVSSSLKALAGDVKALPMLKRTSRSDNIALVFTGQGAQWPAMGRELQRHPIFKKCLVESQSFLASFGCTWNGNDILSDPESKLIDIPEYCQPICTMLQIALVDLLICWGVEPKGTVGHSSGEIGAAYAASGISHESAVKIAYFRGVYVDEIQRRLKDKKGTMLAIGLTEGEVRAYLETVTGGTAVIGCSAIQKDFKFARKLRVNVAYQSPHMEVVADDFLKSMGSVETLENFSIPMFSSVTEKVVSKPTDLDAAYWVKNMVSAVRFSGAVTSLLSHSPGPERGRRKPVAWSAVIELGPHESLKGPLNQIMAAVNKKLSSSVTYGSLVKRKQNAELTAMETAGLLWCLGHSVDIARVNGEEPDQNLRTLVDLRPYPWQHTKGFWHKPPASSAARMRSQPRTDLLGVPVDDSNTLEPEWRNYLRLPENPWMEDHAITGTILYPAAGMLIMVLEAAYQIADSTKKLAGVEFQDVIFDRGLVISSADQAVEVSLSIRPHESLDSSYYWTIFSMPPGGTWVKQSFGTFSIVYEQPLSDVDLVPVYVAEWKVHSATFENIKACASKCIDPSGFYDQLQCIGMCYGPLFRRVTEAAPIPGKHTGHGTIEIPNTKSCMPQEHEFGHSIHPTTLDAVFHLIFIALFEGKPMDEASVPVKMEKMFIAADLPKGAGSKYSGFSTAVKVNSREASGDLIVSDESWTQPKIIVHNMVTSSVVGESPKRVARMEWREDLDYLQGSNAQRLLMNEAFRYKDTNLSGPGAQLGVWLDRACHKHADLKVLVKKGQVNLNLLSLLGRFAPKSVQGLRFRESKQVLDQNSLNVHLKLLGLQQVSQNQLTELGRFDVILTDTRGLPEDQYGLRVAKSLLRPDGALGLLNRRASSSADETAMLLYLKDAGLAGPAIFIENEAVDVIIASVGNDEESKIADGETHLLLPNTNPSPDVIALKENLSNHLESLGIKVKTATLSDALALEESTVISLLEAQSPLVVSWGEEQLLQFQQLITSANYLLWVTCGGIFNADPRSLEYAPTTGLLRTLRVELPQMTLPHLDLCPSRDLASESTAELLATVLALSTKLNADSKSNEMELVESDGSIYIPRVVTDQSLDLELELHSDRIRPVQGRLHRKTTDKDAAEPLPEEHVEIRTTHVSLNALDLNAISRNGARTGLGREAVGLISRVGSKVIKFQPGDRVVAISRHSFRTHICQHQMLVQKAPESVRSEVIVTLPTSFITAFHALIEIGRLSKGESVLIHSAAGGLGQAAIQIAKHAGGVIFVTVGSGSKKNLLVERYGLAEDHIFDSREFSLAAKALWATQGKGFDVIFSSCSGAALRQLSSCLAEFGCFVDIGRKIDVQDMHTASLRGNALFASVDLVRYSDSKHAHLLAVVCKMLAKSQIGEIFPTNQYSVSELPKALDLLKSRDHSGKIVVTLEGSAVVPLLPQAPPSLELKADATYVVSGGLGALGLTIAENMYQHGARHLVLLSRSGASTSRQQVALQSFRDRGCTVDAPKCNVTDASQLQIKGVVQCAMVLRYSIFENMTIDKWSSATRPKITGTWNLHTHMPRDLDFFIILSSMSGIIGNTAQANYCAGNTYEDAIAYHRHKQGLAATTLNVGLVTDASHFTDDSTVEDYLRRYSHWLPAQVTDHEMQVVLTAAMRGRTADGAGVPTQLLVGITDDFRREDGRNLWPHDRKFDHRVRPSSQSDDSNKHRLERATTLGAAEAAARDALAANVAAAITVEPEDIDVQRPLYSFGVDSLKAIEVRNWIFRELRCELSVFDLLSSATLSKLARITVAQSTLGSKEVAAQAAAAD